jgi:hypothetical protein
MMRTSFYVHTGAYKYLQGRGCVHTRIRAYSPLQEETGRTNWKTMVLVTYKYKVQGLGSKDARERGQKEFA